MSIYQANIMGLETYKKWKIFAEVVRNWKSHSSRKAGNSSMFLYQSQVLKLPVQ